MDTREVLGSLVELSNTTLYNLSSELNAVHVGAITHAFRNLDDRSLLRNDSLERERAFRVSRPGETIVMGVLSGGCHPFGGKTGVETDAGSPVSDGTRA